MAAQRRRGFGGMGDLVGAALAHSEAQNESGPSNGNTPPTILAFS